MRDNPEEEFELESSSALISILSYNSEKRKYVSHSIDIVDSPLLALGWKDPLKGEEASKFHGIQSAHRNVGAAERSGQKAMDFSDYDHFPVNPEHI